LMAVNKGWIFPGKIVEDQMIVMSAGSLKANTNPNRTEDYDDYSDAKFISASFTGPKPCNGSYTYDISIGGDAIKNKKGALRVVVYERKQNRLYYFYIPRRAYRDYKWIDIPFKLNGDPKVANHWWAYEIDSFKDLARIKKEDWINVR